MSALHVAVVLVTDPPTTFVAVRAPGSLAKPSEGLVLIEHLSVTGRSNRIERPVDETVPLFWRFMIEKFGVDPGAFRRMH